MRAQHALALAALLLLSAPPAFSAEEEPVEPGYQVWKETQDQEPANLPSDEKSNDAKARQAQEEISQEAQYGVGIMVSKATNLDETYPVITGVMQGGPADRAGVRIGMQLWQIDNHDLSQMNIERIERMLRGSKNSTTTLDIPDMTPEYVRLVREIDLSSKSASEKLMQSYRSSGYQHDPNDSPLRREAQAAQQHAQKRVEDQYEKQQSKSWQQFLKALTSGNKPAASRIASSLDQNYNSKMLLDSTSLTSNISSKLGKFARITVTYDSDAPGGILAFPQKIDLGFTLLNTALTPKVPDRIFLAGAPSGKFVSGETFTVIGRVKGTYKYDTLIGGTNTVPAIRYEYIFRR